MHDHSPNIPDSEKSGANNVPNIYDKVFANATDQLFIISKATVSCVKPIDNELTPKPINAPIAALIVARRVISRTDNFFASGA